MNVVLISQGNIIGIWPLVCPFIDRAIAEGGHEYSSQEVLDELIRGKSQLWIGYDEKMKLKMVGTTKVEVWPNLKKLRIELLAGEQLEEFYPSLPQLEAWAKEHGCTKTITAVRPGLRKLLVRDLGFKPAFETVTRDII